MQAADLSHRGFLGATAVSRASRRGDAPVLRALLAHPDAVACIHAPNDHLQTPLHFAAYKRNPAAVQVLLEAAHARGTVAEVLDAADRKGRTPDKDTDVPSIRDAIGAVRDGADPASTAPLLNGAEEAPPRRLYSLDSHT